MLLEVFRSISPARCELTFALSLRYTHRKGYHRPVVMEMEMEPVLEREVSHEA